MVTVKHSHYWQDSQLHQDALVEAYQELTNPGDVEARFASFLTLLRSGDSVAAGVAMDHYEMSESGSRMGGVNPLDVYSGEVLQIARATLESPPSPASLSPHTGEGANHASALLATANIISPQDFRLVKKIIDTTTNGEVRNLALASCSRVVGAKDADDIEFVQLLGVIAYDVREAPQNRISAISALGSMNTDQSVEALSIAMGDPDISIQAHIALAILQMDCAARWIDQLKRLAASWPAKAPFPADDVRDLLEDEW
ncbi:hypothetical protein [Streptomyces sp. Inha503]|uniref:hypothetical protein n=1 Tax=Streptomyces sp. Inha503 TaxID=3383314 RepID=UPI0039A369E8